MASALINAARNTGGSIGISLANNVLWDRQQFHQSRLAADAAPSSIEYQDTLHQVTQYFIAKGSLPAQAASQAVAWIGQEIALQSSYLAYSDVFFSLMLMALAAVPLALSLRKVSSAGAAPQRIEASFTRASNRRGAKQARQGRRRRRQVSA